MNASQVCDRESLVRILCDLKQCVSDIIGSNLPQLQSNPNDNCGLSSATLTNSAQCLKSDPRKIICEIRECIMRLKSVMNAEQNKRDNNRDVCAPQAMENRNPNMGRCDNFQPKMDFMPNFNKNGAQCGMSFENRMNDDMACGRQATSCGTSDGSQERALSLIQELKCVLCEGRSSSNNIKALELVKCLEGLLSGCTSSAVNQCLSQIIMSDCGGTPEQTTLINIVNEPEDIRPNEGVDKRLKKAICELYSYLELQQNSIKEQAMTMLGEIRGKLEIQGFMGCRV